MGCLMGSNGNDAETREWDGWFSPKSSSPAREDMLSTYPVRRVKPCPSLQAAHRAIRKQGQRARAGDRL